MVRSSHDVFSCAHFNLVILKLVLFAHVLCDLDSLVNSFPVKPKAKEGQQRNNTVCVKNCHK